MNGGTLILTVTLSHPCTTIPSPSCSTNKFQLGGSPVVVDRPVSGLTMSVVQQSAQCGRCGEQFDAPVQLLTRRSSPHGAPSLASTWSFYDESVQPSVRLASTPSSRSHVVSGDHSTSCLVEARHLRRLTSTRQRSTASSMTKSQQCAPPPPVQIHLPSRLHPSAACFGCSRQSRQTT